MILIVEDNPQISRGIRHIIEEMDSCVEVMTTAYAAKALQYAGSLDISLFILDVQLLDYSGLELAKQLRSMAKHELTPILFITGDANVELEAYRQTQCHRFISKPFVMGEVRKAIMPFIKNQHGELNKSKKLILKQRGFGISIDQDDILYLEAANRRVRIVTRQEQTEVASYTLGGMLEHLTDDFLQCHKGYIVNTKWIVRFDRMMSTIQLKDHKELIPVGDKYRDMLIKVGL